MGGCVLSEEAFSPFMQCYAHCITTVGNNMPAPFDLYNGEIDPDLKSGGTVETR